MIREYATPREHLDDVLAQVERMARRHDRAARASDDEATERAVAELELEIDRMDEMMRARCDASHELGISLPLDRVRRAFELSPTENRAIEVLVALELAAEVRRIAGPYLDGHGFATIELLESLVFGMLRRGAERREEHAADARLFQLQLAHLGSSELPWLVRPVRVAARVIDLALGHLRLDPEVARVASLVREPERGDGLLLDDAQRELVEAAMVAQTERPGAPIPLVVGPSGAGRGSIVHAAAHRLARPVLDVRGAALPRNASELNTLFAAILREAMLFGAVVLVRDLETLANGTDHQGADLVPDVVATLPRTIHPVAFTAASNVWPPSSARTIVLVELGVPSEADRETLWNRALGAPSPEVARRAAERYRVTAGVIQRAAEFAHVQATARSAPIALDDVRVGIRLQLDRELATLGHRVEWNQTWDDVVLPEDIRTELRDLIGRIKYRRRVLDEWGFARKLAKGVGVSALFSGPPGTGKTMVASLVAKELELDLYMIDASRMVSKWIGETEKNLARLFDAAGAGHAALLFDEADSLFARRTDVRSSTDRYANLEVNYLLQRMEAFEGVTILTTNLESSIDDAFKRRLAFRIAFPLPEEDERAQLWRAMLPAQASMAKDIDFGALANRYAMSGGYIRNAVVRAAYLAAAESSAISMRHLLRGATLEYTAMGKIVHQGSL